MSLDIVINHIIDDTILSNECKEILMDYSRDTQIHSNYCINFGDLLIGVWNRCSGNPEIKQILDSEMKESL